MINSQAALRIRSELAVMLRVDRRQRGEPLSAAIYLPLTETAEGQWIYVGRRLTLSQVADVVIELLSLRAEILLELGTRVDDSERAELEREVHAKETRLTIEARTDGSLVWRR
jgi:hypothetical protein